MAWAGAWEKVGNLWFRDMPATSVDEFVSRRTGLIVIQFDDVEYVVTTADKSVVGRFEQLGDAIRGGDDFVDSLEATCRAEFVLSAGLDPAAWVFEHEDSFVWFSSVAQPDARVERHGAKRWVACKLGRSIGIAATPNLAASLLQ